MLNDKKKLLRWLIPIGIIVILFLSLWTHQIINVRQLPSKGWSRTIHPDIPSEFEKPYVFKDRENTHLFTATNQGIIHSVLDKNLIPIKKMTIKTKKDVEKVLWADLSAVIYKMNGDLYLHKAGNDRMIAKNVSAATANEDSLYYAQDSSLHVYDITSGQGRLLSTFPDPVQAVDISEKEAVVVTQDSASACHFYYLPKSDISAHSPKEFALFNGISHGNISVLQMVRHDGKIGIFFTTHILKQGEYFYDYYIEYTQNQLTSAKEPIMISEVPITYDDPSTGDHLGTPMNSYLFLKNGKPALLFSSEGHRTARDTAINIYEGRQNDKGNWVAEKRSTSAEMSLMPFVIDNQTIGWLDYITDNHYQIGLASKKPEIIKQSLKIRAQDFSQSLSSAVLSLPRVFMFFLLAISYAIPTILVYAVITFTKVELIERDSQAVKWVLLGIFLISQYFLIGHTQTPAFHTFAPAYLTFPFSRWLIPAIMAVLTWLLLKWLKSKDWSIIIETFYAVTLYLIMELFTFGPYFF
ncbi:MAG: hypothetical protein ACO1OC_04980 [Tuberibacillus sp.]